MYDVSKSDNRTHTFIALCHKHFSEIINTNKIAMLYFLVTVQEQKTDFVPSIHSHSCRCCRSSCVDQITYLLAMSGLHAGSAIYCLAMHNCIVQPTTKSAEEANRGSQLHRALGRFSELHSRCSQSSIADCNHEVSIRRQAIFDEFSRISCVS